MSPEGEIHGFPSAVIASVLKSKGYKVYNATPSVPTDQILGYIRNLEPDLIMVSITLVDNIKAGERLVQKIKSKFETPVLVGGLALVSGKGNFRNAIILRPQENSVEDVLRLIRYSLRRT